MTINDLDKLAELVKRERHALLSRVCDNRYGVELRPRAGA